MKTQYFVRQAPFFGKFIVMDVATEERINGYSYCYYVASCTNKLAAEAAARLLNGKCKRRKS